MPPISKSSAGNVEILLQSIVYSPPTIGVAPIISFSFFTSSVGPAIREVPVSAIALHPSVQNDFSPPIATLLDKPKIFWKNNFHVSDPHAYTAYDTI